MQRKTKWIVGGAVASTLIIGGVASGTAQQVVTGDDQPLTGEIHDKVVAAALEHTGGGTVTETELGDDGAAYSVEILLENGRQVEVNLDQSYRVVGQENDDDVGEVDDD